MLLLRVGPLGLGPLELVIILLVLVMIFGASRLADIGGSLGKGIKEFRKEVQIDEPDEDPQNGAQPSASTNGAAETVSAVKCASCGALNEANAKHCNQCGAAIGSPTANLN